jgi:hypothetical protein
MRKNLHWRFVEVFEIKNASVDVLFVSPDFVESNSVRMWHPSLMCSEWSHKSIYYR